MKYPAVTQISQKEPTLLHAVQTYLRVRRLHSCLTLTGGKPWMKLSARAFAVTVRRPPRDPTHASRVRRTK